MTPTNALGGIDEQTVADTALVVEALAPALVEDFAVVARDANRATVAAHRSTTPVDSPPKSAFSVRFGTRSP